MQNIVSCHASPPLGNSTHYIVVDCSPIVALLVPLEIIDKATCGTVLRVANHWKQDRVNDVNHAVVGLDVRFQYLCVANVNLVTTYLNREIASLKGRYL